MKRLIIRILFLAAAAPAVVTPPIAGAGEFLVRPGGQTKVVFVSKAAMERFEGKTSRMEGRILVDPAAVGDSVTVHLEVDLASLDTGIAKRNAHMRDHHLETGKYPKAMFDGATVRGPGGVMLVPGKPVVLDLEGSFTLHGVSRRIRINVEALHTTQNGSGRIEFHTAFPVALADYEISRPQFLFIKLAATQDVRVSGVAVAETPGR